jgi:ADP-heptose:LPS heptosyltransferase
VLHADVHGVIVSFGSTLRSNPPWYARPQFALSPTGPSAANRLPDESERAAARACERSFTPAAASANYCSQVPAPLILADVTEAQAPERILIVRLSAMGDVLQALPALAALRAARPGAEIGWVVERRFAGLLEGHPSIDRLFVFERRKGAGLTANAGALHRLRAELRDWGPDVAVDAQGNLRGGVVTRISGAPRRIALPAPEAREGSHHLATERVSPASDRREHRAERALRLLRPLLGDLAPTREAGTETAPLLPPVPDEARAAVAAGLAEMDLADRPFALFVAGTSDFGAFKRWPAEHFGTLATRLREERGLPVLVSWGPGQESLARTVADASGGAARPAPATRSLAELRALLEASVVVIGADSGPVVLAGVAGLPTVALFGPKDPAVYAPPGDSTSLVWKGAYCSPCTLRRCDDPICMTQMTPDDAWPAVKAALARAELRAESGT